MIFFTGFLYTVFIAANLSVEVFLEDKKASGVRVDLYEIVPGQGPQPLLHRKTNAKGLARFRFQEKKDSTYVLSATYQDQNYFSTLFSSKQIPKRPLPIKVFKTLEWSDELAIQEVLYSLETNHQDMKVRQEIILHNPTSQVILAANRPLLAFDLPKGAYNLEFGYGFSQDTTQFEKNNIVFQTRLSPGVTTLSLHYDVEKPGMAHDFNQSFSLPVKKISIGSSHAPLHLSGYAFQEFPSKFFQNQWVRLWESPLLNTREVAFEVRGLPLFIPWVKLGPLVGLVFLLLLLGLLMQFTKPNLNSKDPPRKDLLPKEELLDSLRTLKTMKQKELLSTDEYLKRRYQLLVQLYPHYT